MNLIRDHKNQRMLDRARVPDPIFDKEPGFVKLYWKTWELAFEHVSHLSGLPQSPYMDEGFQADTIWIWDTCFMALFCRYCPDQFPGVESLQNFYSAIHDEVEIPLIIQHPDNPPLFAWVELDYYRFTNDRKRLHKIVKEKGYLQKHYQWFSEAVRGEKHRWAGCPVALKPSKIGFQWNGISSGMDNSPRFVSDPFAIDAISQQGLAAASISKIAGILGDTEISEEYFHEFQRLKNIVNDRYWDEEDGFYYDLLDDAKTYSKVRTPASFWPIFAGMASPLQVSRAADYLRVEDELGGSVPWVTLSRSSPDFDSQTGNYWRGAVWLPTAYMGIRALGENGHCELADSTAEQVLRLMLKTFEEYDQQTIWECYHPIKPEPARHGAQVVRPDFCGWSALGPVSLFIENILGFHYVDAQEGIVKWRLHQPGRHGIRGLRFGNIQTDIIADGNDSVEIAANSPYTLEINGTAIKVKAGDQVIILNEEMRPLSRAI